MELQLTEVALQQIQAERQQQAAGLNTDIPVGLRNRPEEKHGLPGVEARFVGRASVLHAMADQARYLAKGVGGLIWIEGEAGIGKSRLMREFAALVQAKGALVWAGHCSPQRSGLALSLFSDLLARVFDLLTTDSPEQTREKIDRALSNWPAELRPTRPYLELMSGLSPAGLDGARLASLSPDQLRQQTFVALRGLFSRLAAERPLVLLLDDLQWIDPMSIESLMFLSTVVAVHPVLFVCARRREEALAATDRLAKVQKLHPAHTLEIVLDPLTKAESETLLSELLPGTELPASLRAVILDRCEGNAYHVEEFVRAIVEQGYLQRLQGTVEPSFPLEDSPLPFSLETLVRSRMDALPSDLKQLLQCAAVIGSPFEVNLLTSVSEQANAVEGLAQLESRGILKPSAINNHWQFSHSSTETVVYNGLLEPRRQALHRMVAQALEAYWAGAEEAHAEELAYHYTQASDRAKALTYLVQAGERAAARYANEEALAYYQRADQWLASLPPADEDIRWRVCVGLGDVYRFTGEYAKSMAALKSALPILKTAQVSRTRQAGVYRRLGETAQKQEDLAAGEYFDEAIAVLGEPTDSQAQVEASRIMVALAWNHLFQGHPDRARIAAEAGLKYAEQSGNLLELAAAENVLGRIDHHQGAWQPALNHTMRAMELREQMGYTWGVASSLSNLGVLAIMSGDWSKARSFFARGLAQHYELGNMEGVAMAHRNLGSLDRDQGRLHQAKFHFGASLEVARPLNMAYYMAAANLGLAEVFLLGGDIRSAQDMLKMGQAQAEAIGAEEQLAESARIGTGILMAQSAWEPAKIEIKRVATMAAQVGNRRLEATVCRMASEIELAQGDLKAAREYLAQAQLALADTTDQLESGRVALLAGRVSLREENHEQAGQELRLAQSIFADLEVSLDLQQAERWLAELGD